MTASLSPADLQILHSGLCGVAEEMSAVLRRSAFSPNIKERADCSTALFTPSGELLAQAENIPIHLGSMAASVLAVIETLPPGGLPDAMFIVNDPFAGGTHLNDITLVAPCVVEGRLIGWVANRAHHADVGGDAPGSMPADATHIDQEGLRLPPQSLTDEVFESVIDASRTGAERRGDLAAQLGANEIGSRRLAEFAGRPLDEVVDYGERRMAAALAGLPDGVWQFGDALDSFGPADHQQSPVAIELTLRIGGDRITFDFRASDPQVLGNVNAPAAVTASAVAFALRVATDPTIPANGGAMRPVQVLTSPGSVVSAQAPAAVGAGNVEISQRLADVCLGALAQVVPDRIPAASQGTMNNVLIGTEGWVYYETIGGGQGARPGRAGMSGVHTNMTNTRNTPVEAFERSFPMRVRRYRLRTGSGGRGAAAGGDGIERDIELLEPSTVSLITERRGTPPWGLAGGDAAAVGENRLLPGGDESAALALPDKCTIEAGAGDVVSIHTPGGGGWGPVSGS